jgi:hypothetical protein
VQLFLAGGGSVRSHHFNHMLQNIHAARDCFLLFVMKPA